MRLLFSIFALFLIASSGQAQVIIKDNIKKFTPADSLLTLQNQVPLSDTNIVEVPIYNPPTDAKILVWWPQTEYHYGMPNTIQPNKSHQLSGLKNNEEEKQEEKEDK